MNSPAVQTPPLSNSELTTCNSICQLVREGDCGIKIDIGHLTTIQNLIKTYGQLELAPLETIEAIETFLDVKHPQSGHEFIHVGRTTFELVSSREAFLFKKDRHDQEASPVLTIEKPDLLIFNGKSNLRLYNGILRNIQERGGIALFSNFANSETAVEVLDSVRKKEVFILQSFPEPVNENLIELVFLVDALKRASAAEINVVIPYYPYSRQDRKGDKRAPISAALVANILKNSGVDRVVTFDLHSPQTEGYFDGPLDNLYAYPLMTPHLCEKYHNDDLIIVAPDAGAMKRLGPMSRDMEQYFESYYTTKKVPIACMEKERNVPNTVGKMNFIGDPTLIKDRTAIISDDMIDTGGTILKAAEILRELGAKRIIACATHPILSGNAVERFRNTLIKDSDRRLVDELVVTDSLPLRRGKGDLITVISLSELLAESISRIHRGNGDSLRELVNFRGTTNASLH